MKVNNKAVRQYEDVNDEEHCVVNIFEKYLSSISRHDKLFYFFPLPDDGPGGETAENSRELQWSGAG